MLGVVGFSGVLLLMAVLMAGCVTAPFEEPGVEASTPGSAPAGVDTQVRPTTSATVTPRPISDPSGAGGTRETESSGGYDDGKDDHYTEIEFRGVLSAVEGNTWLVNGQQVIIPDSMNVTSAQVGDVVKVEAWLSADGQLTAKEIEIEASSQPNHAASPDDHSGDDGSGDHADDSSDGQADDHSDSNDGSSSSDDGSGGDDHHDDSQPDDSGDDGGHDGESGGD